MPEVSHRALQQAIRDLHGCDSVWIESVPIKETFRGETVWDGIVQVFDLKGHLKATRCYAWSHVTKGRKRRFVAVLHQGPIDSPQAAVKAAVIQEFRSGDST